MQVSLPLDDWNIVQSALVASDSPRADVIHDLIDSALTAETAYDEFLARRRAALAAHDDHPDHPAGTATTLGTSWTHGRFGKQR